MSKKPGLYANIHAKRKRGEKMRKPGEEGAPSAKDFRDAAKTAKKKKGVKRQDPKGNPAGYYDKDGCKKCSKEDMGRKGPYADGYGKKCDAVAEELSGLLINDAERSDKPCGNSYIPEAAKCNKGRGTAKASKESLKKRALAKEREVNKGRNVRPTAEQAKQQAQAKYTEMQRVKAIRSAAKPILRNTSRETIKRALEANKGNTSIESRTMEKAAKRELFNRNVRNVAAAGLYGVAAGSLLSSALKKRRR